MSSVGAWFSQTMKGRTYSRFEAEAQPVELQQADEEAVDGEDHIDGMPTVRGHPSDRAFLSGYLVSRAGRAVPGGCDELASSPDPSEDEDGHLEVDPGPLTLPELRKSLENSFDGKRMREFMLDELGDDYEAARRDTLEQLEEFDCSLRRLATGDVTLETELGVMRLAIQAAVSEAFHTPEVIRLFAKQQPRDLRARLAQLERDGKPGAPEMVRQKAEILAALRSLGETFCSNRPVSEIADRSPESDPKIPHIKDVACVMSIPLSSHEEEFLLANASSALSQFEAISGEQGSADKILALASHSAHSK